MNTVFNLLPLLILFVCLAMLYNEGIWNNAIRVINVVTAALLATNYFEPAARWLDDMNPWSGWDFLALWVLFFLSFSIFRVLTELVSPVKVKFLELYDKIGSPVLALWVGWVIACFTMMSLHTAPLSNEFLYGGFKSVEQTFGSFAPDRMWLGFVQKESLGAYCRLATPEEWKEEKYVFDPQGEFSQKYTSRRVSLAAGDKK